MNTKALGFILLWAALLQGQTTSTEILGTVTDPTGALIAGAQVTVLRTATGQKRVTITTATGDYSFPLIDIGEYEVTCSAPGFKTEVRRGIVLQLQEKARIDFQMQVGEQVETVEIRGAPHTMHRTHTANFNAALLAFLQSH